MGEGEAEGETVGKGQGAAEMGRRVPGLEERRGVKREREEFWCVCVRERERERESYFIFSLLFKPLSQVKALKLSLDYLMRLELVF
jgi:hypothetical protein